MSVIEERLVALWQSEEIFTGAVKEVKEDVHLLIICMHDVVCYITFYINGSVRESELFISMVLLEN